MAVRTYDPKATIIIVGGFPISGFADGTFVKVTRSSDAFAKSVGADGDTTRIKSNDLSGEIIITLSQTSQGNDILSALAVRDELTNTGVVPVSVKDLLGTSTFVSASCWVRKQADAENGKEAATREWVLDVADLAVFVGGNFVSGI